MSNATSGKSNDGSVNGTPLWVKGVKSAGILIIPLLIVVISYSIVSVPEKALSLMLVGAISFFGILVYARIYAPEGSNLDSGEMRKAIAGSIVLVYFYVLAIALFEDTKIEATNTIIDSIEALSLDEASQDITVNISESLIESITTLVQVVVAFYFGGRTAEEIVKNYMKSND